MAICGVHPALLYPSICLNRKGECVLFSTPDALFLVDTLPTLGYTLAGFHDVITSMHTGDQNQPGCVYARRVRRNRDLILSLTLKEVHEWPNQ
jgi:hypothetical protein